MTKTGKKRVRRAMYAAARRNGTTIDYLVLKLGQVRSNRETKDQFLRVKEEK